MQEKAKSKLQGSGVAAQTGSGTNEAFVQHLKHASIVVKTWPVWKQQILGAVFFRADREVK